MSGEVERERVRSESVREGLKRQLEEKEKAYKSLEEEFRMALRIEADRYQEVC